MKFKKPIKLISLLLLTAVMGVTACTSSKQKAEAERADSVRIADSIAHAQEQIAAQREQALRDSIEQVRQDSIAKVEEFRQKLPSFSRLFHEYDNDINIAYLKGLGYKVSKKGKIYEDRGEGEEITTCGYYLDANHYCTVEFVVGFEWGSTIITIVGAPEQLKQMKAEANRYKADYERESDGGGSYMEIKGNHIAWGGGA